MSDKIKNLFDSNEAEGINLYDTLAINKESLIFKDSTSGEVITKESMVSILNDAEKSDKLPKAIHVDIEATHSGITKNFTEYMPENMERSAKTWTKPYNKPVLYGHNSDRENLGRVIAYEYKTSELNPEKETIKLTLEITDPASIRRHMDGTALTYSIGAKAKQVYCSICRTDIINSDSYCGHWKGRNYKVKREEGDKEVKETCIWQIGDVEYIEVSEVNVPADIWAQKLSVKVKEEDAMKDEFENQDTNATLEDNTNDKNIEDSVLDQIDGILDDNTDNENEVPTEDSANNTNEDVAEEDNSTNEVTVESLQDRVVLLDTSINELNERVNTLEDDIAKSEEANKVLQETNDTLTNELTEASENAKKQKEINLNLAKLIKKTYTESIIRAKIRLGDILEENQTNEYDNLIILSVKDLATELNLMLEKEKAIPKSLPTLTAADVGDEGALGVYQENVDSNINKTTEKKTKLYTASDAVNSLLE